MIRKVLSFFLLTLAAIGASAEPVDYTDRIDNASCSEPGCWYINSGGENCILQLDTWSSRGGKDGSGMTVPFYEYFINAPSGTLSDAEIRHEMVEGLPKGNYTLTVLVRLYDESGRNYPNDAVCLVANGKSVSIAKGAEEVEYNGQYALYKTASIQFYVNNDGTLDFGFDVAGADFNWLAFKDVQLFYDGDTSNQDTNNGEPAKAELRNGEYYIKHVATGKWLGQGGRFDTEAVLSDVPTAYLINLESDGVISIGSTLTSQHLTEINGNIWNDQYYSKWNITKQNGINTYNLRTEGGKYMMAATTDEMVNEVISGSTHDLWQLYTKEDLMATLTSATASHPVDATFLITNPGMSRNSNGIGWMGGPVLGGAETDDPMSNYCAERWNCNFDIFQEISDLPNGYYTLSVKGFYRNGGYNYAAEQHSNGTEVLAAQLYADNESVPLMSIFEKDPDATYYGRYVYTQCGFVPDDMTGASTAFLNGEYNKNSLTVHVKNNSLTIGIRKDELTGEDWTIFDDFRLTYLGKDGNNGGNNEDDNEEDDQIKSLLTATKANPKDATFLIKKMSGNESYSVFKRRQTVTGLPNGLYKASLQGFYRYGRYDTEGYYSYGGADNAVWATYTQAFAVVNRKNGTEILFPKFYANEQSVPLMSVFEHAHANRTHNGDFETELGWVPNDANSAKAAFNEGDYTNEVWVYVTDGTLELGVDKQGGYKHDWTYWANATLTYYGAEDIVYATGVETDASSYTITRGEKRQISAEVIPANASVRKVSYKTSNSGIVSIDANGMMTGKGSGTATITAYTSAGNKQTVSKVISVKVNEANGDPSALVINEIQPANIDMYLDPSRNYGGWIELYNPTDQAISLSGCTVSDDESNPWKGSVRSDAVVPAHGFCNIWFDHYKAASSQIDFKLNPEGGMIALYRSGSLISKQTYPSIAPRISYARTQNGGPTWQFTATPTPASTNAGSKDFVPENAQRLAKPVATSDTQIFENSVSVSVEIPDGATLLYTTDGTAPLQSNGKVSNGTFTFTTSTTLRLRFYKDGMIPSPVATYSYLKRDKDYTLPILSIVSAPDNFYDNEIGVFTVGTAGRSGSGQDLACNWNMEWERPVNMEYISEEGEQLLSQECDLERCGGWSRSWFPYSFKLKGSKQYEGQNSIDYQFFPEDKPFNKHKALQIRNGGNDLLCRVKDVTMNQIVLTSGLYVDAISYQPSHVFVNGVYQGLMNIREPNNKHFAYSNYAIDDDYIDQFEFHWGYDVKAGTDQAFKELRNLCYNASSKATYQEIRKRLDIDEFINYMAVQLYLGGDDWPGNNCKGFIDQNDGKLHLVLFDLDQALRFNEQSLSRVAWGISNPIPNMWYNLMQNEEFKQQFLNAYSIVACSVFDPERTHGIIDNVANRVESPLSLEGLEPWTNANESKGILTKDRRDLMMKALSHYDIFGVRGKTAKNALIKANIEEARILLNNQPIVTGKYEGPIYLPATLSAKAPMGYNFEGWKDSKGKIVSTKADYTVSSTGNAEITACFSRSVTGFAPVSVNEVSASNEVNVNSDYFKKDDWIELYNTTDHDIDVAGMYLTDNASEPQKFHIPANDTQETIIPANGHLVVWASKRTATGKDLHANFKLGNKEKELVMLTSEDGTWCDTLRYRTHGARESVGRYPDGGSDVYTFLTPTISKNNLVTSYSDYLYTYVYNGTGTEEPSFTLDLAEGWNWISHPLQRNVAVSEINEGGLSIQGMTASAEYRPASGWTGSLKELTSSDAYKIEMQSTKSYTLYGEMQNISNSIPLHQGWNWIGYHVLESQPLEDALSSFTPNEGDVMVSQSGFSTFEKGKWSGTLTALHSGIGYLYKSARPNAITYSAASSASLARPRFIPQPRTAWSANATEYPNVMGMVATIVADGMEAAEGAYSVGAFADNGECRGVGSYVDGRLWLTIYGNGGESLTFKAADASTGVVYDVNESTSFSADIFGSRTNPAKLTIGTPTGIASVRNAQALKSAGYYGIDGTYLGSQKDKLRSGTYILKYELHDGTIITNKIMVR